MEITLADIKPTGASFTLRKTAKTYRLNPVSLADEMWMEEEFGDRIKEIFEKVRMKEICRIVFRLMDHEDRSDFAAQDVVFMNEQGESMTKRMGGPELIYLNVSGYEEKIEIFKALAQTIGVSRPLLEKLSGQESAAPEKKSQPTGSGSSIISPTNTGGQRNTSSRERPAKSQAGSKRSKPGKNKT